MDHIAANPFAAMVDFSQVARAMAASLQLNLLARRQYSPLDKPARGRTESGDEVAVFDAVVESDADAGTDAVVDAGSDLPDWGSFVPQCSSAVAPPSSRIDFADACPELVTGTGPVQRFG